MPKNIFILTTLFLLSCGTRPTDSTTTTKETDSLTISKIEDVEEFNEFFEKFTTDSLFQMERTKFPFHTLWTTEDGETVHETAKDDWTHSTFHYEDSYAKRQVDAYTQEIKNYKDSVVIELRGIDNGIYIDYKFTRDKGKWILFLGRDYSN